MPELKVPGLKIKDVERIVLNVPFTPRAHKWNALLVWQWSITEIIRVTADAPGLVGYGETILHYSWGKVTDEAVARVKGRNAAELLGDDSLGPGLQMALYDLVGKALNVPVYRLFNLPRVREWCPIAWWNTKMSPEDLAHEAKEAAAQGYLAHKMKARPWFDAFEQVKAITGVTPPGYRIGMDWNGMLLTAGNAVPVLRGFDADPRVSHHEEPIPQRDVEGYKVIRPKLAKPIATHFGSPPFTTAVREETCDGFVISGGVSQILRDGALAGAFAKPFWLQMVGTGFTTALCAHLGAVLEFARMPAVTVLNNYSDDLLDKPFAIQGGCIQVPEGPGLGIAVDQEALKRYKMQPPYSLPEQRHIISIVWPNGRVVHYAHMMRPKQAQPHYSHLRFESGSQAESGPQCWEDFLAGNQPVQERGVRMEVRLDDGSKDWAELYARAERGPVLEARSY